MDVLMCFVKSVEKHAACGPIATLAVEEPEEDISTEKLAEIMSLAVEREREARWIISPCAAVVVMCGGGKRKKGRERQKRQNQKC